MDDSFQILDESGDRKYFTIIPNYVLNHSTLYDRELYVQMKRLAGEKGTCWASRSTLAKQCGMSPRRIDKSLKYLVEHGWIKNMGPKIGSTSGGPQKVNEYAIADLWKKNIEFYEEKRKGVAPYALPSSQRGSTVERKGVAPGAQKEEPLQEDKYTATSADFRIEEETPDRPPRVKVLEGYKTMLRWAESRRGFPFLAIPKQCKALKLAKDNGIKSAPLKERWVEFEDKDFWKDKGFDWMDVVMSFNKRA